MLVKLLTVCKRSRLHTLEQKPGQSQDLIPGVCCSHRKDRMPHSTTCFLMQHEEPTSSDTGERSTDPELNLGKSVKHKQVLLSFFFSPRCYTSSVII